MADPRLKAFGQRVRELRKERGYSQENFAALAGVDRSYMGQIERGEKNITLAKLFQISDALNVGYNELFNWNK
ncbi:MAG: helix-turn-helix transcriptional regulator [Cytophagia bacterium]|nr:helix-turn-helix transcriptional regulator [Cytophagia bacterium]